mmetsp:Transcript_11038/g.23008  ORF Transcript_11038/g.23008 Transcript_11038/m.23008 type:complete len:253 (+) Transcript_11038:314-1072(+)|eukprot:CAMPEP_0118926276 /NCGR_PEP_ID=MMETSP1169-20130426/4009_1 /TAXON_ID=36882 /ORGANISM="Pyramimonas obovata, Strain CCMP722" /LENGTH=252 /DNA_ID=CAMNT_0006867795 /DNA_START=291 /DNA_END=1049 /DNA_ORIENTATION=-
MGWVPPSIARKRSEIELRGEDASTPVTEEEDPSVRSFGASRVRFSLDDQVRLVKTRSKTEFRGDVEQAYRADTIEQINCALRDGVDPDYGLLAWKRYQRLSTFATRSMARRFIHALAESRKEKEEEVTAMEDSLRWDETRECCESSAPSPSAESPDNWETVDLEPCTSAPCLLTSPRRSTLTQFNEPSDTGEFQTEQRAVKQQQLVEVLGAFLACFNPLTCVTSSVTSGARSCYTAVPPTSPIARYSATPAS